MGRDAAAMPPAVLKNLRRLMPFFFAMRAPMSFTRASNSFCCGDCGAGMNSSLDTNCTGIGDGNSSSAPDSFRRRRSNGSAITRMLYE